MRVRRWGLVWIGIMLAVGGLGFAEVHPMFYDCLFGRDTVLVISNLTSETSAEAYRLRIYDCIGTLLHDAVGGLGAHGSVALSLKELLAKHSDGCPFGLAIVESEQRIKVGAWFKEDGVWGSVDNGGTWLTQFMADDCAAVWYNLQFADTRNRSSCFMLINPGEEIAVVTGYVYDASGRLLERRDVRIRPHETDVYFPEELDYAPDHVETGGWGVFEVRSTRPLILVGEYRDVDQWLIDLDIVREANAVENRPE